jgi:chemotaxis protein MotB
MKADQPQKPRIIIKKSHGSKHHGGAWKVAYADFVTTMMALFIVLWIVGQSESTREAVAQYFKDPGTFRLKGGPSFVPGHAGILPGQPVEQSGGGKAEGEGSREERALQETAERFKESLHDLGLPQSVRDQVRVEVTREGLRIELRERDGSPFFRVGSAAVIPEVKPIIETLAATLAKLPNHITIEGHTDSRQYSRPDGYSNWELSADRTNTARKIMEAGGLPSGRIDRLVGHADRLPLVPGDTLNAMNRRITILVRRQGLD